ncbi:MAG: hypothetical protein LBE04_05830 [Prevotellaceae bacterium]|nr:hypothetical protein [Prevotellaceae bacterium]
MHRIGVSQKRSEAGDIYIKSNRKDCPYACYPYSNPSDFRTANYNQNLQD